MHDLEPYYNWRDYYTADSDPKSPFFGREYSEFSFSDTIYNHYIHPQWDNMGSPTIYIKILFADYLKGFAIIELIGEWNDAIHNDIMTFKRDIADHLQEEGIYKFILIGENVLNIHTSDDCYYEEWYEDIREEDGWVCFINFREHIVSEMKDIGIHHFVHIEDELQDFYWRKFKPLQLFETVEKILFGEKENLEFQDYILIE